MDTLASQFIDNELELDEKITFVHKVDQDKSFMQEVIDLLHLEKLMRCPAAVPQSAPIKIQIQNRQKYVGWLSWRPLSLAGACAAAVAIALVWFMPIGTPPTAPVAYRFVIYHPQSDQVQIMGSFTGWRAQALRKVGESGYWEITLDVAPGEHRFAYLLDDGQRMADPTIATREQDDFGGENSILRVDV